VLLSKTSIVSHNLQLLGKPSAKKLEIQLFLLTHWVGGLTSKHATMEIGSAEHKAQFIEENLKLFQENIWFDEMNLIPLEEAKGVKRKAIAAINLKLDNKEFPSANEGKRELETAQAELNEIDRQIAGVKAKIATYWPERMELVKRYAQTAKV